MELNKQARRLVQEFQEHVGLEQVDAQRSAFVVLAFRRQWSKARIARYLGVSRARIGQKISKFERYAQDDADHMPTLAQIMGECDGRTERDSGVVVEFSLDKWQDAEFATQLLNHISREPSRELSA